MNRKKVVGLSCILLCVGIFFGLKNDLHISRYIIKSNKVTENIRIVFLSDLHSCKFGHEQEELLHKVRIESPDIILLGGDIIDDRLSTKNAILTLDGLKEIGPVFYVTGNHEIRIGNLEKVKEIVKQFGIKVLDGKSEYININGNEIRIYGMDDSERNWEQYYQQVNVLKKEEFKGLNLLLAHRPERVDVYKDLKADLVFAGHAHGGQWRLPIFLENGLLAPDQGFFPSYTNGIYELEDFTLIVGRGLSRESTRVPRFFNPPEIVVTDIKSNI